MKDICIQEFLRDNLKNNPKADKEVLLFIADFIYHADYKTNLSTSADALIKQFMTGYCYYFAHMLKTAFQRGEVCWSAPFGHIVWVDIDDIPYDICGIYSGDTKYFIPERFLGFAINDFKRMRSKTFDASYSDIENIVRKYLEYLEVSDIEEEVKDVMSLVMPSDE